MRITLKHGALADSYEEQANEYGYTLGDDAGWIQKIGNGIIMGYIHGCITDFEYDKILEWFARRIITKHLKPIEKDGDTE